MDVHAINNLLGGRDEHVILALRVLFMAHGQLSDFIVVGTGYARSPKEISLSRNADGTMARRLWFIGVAFDPGLWKTPRSLLSGFYKASYMPLALRLMSPLQYCSMYAGGHSVLLVLCRAVPQQPAREALRAEIIRPLADLG